MGFPEVKTDVFALRGGLKLGLPALAVKAGSLIDGVNYELDLTGIRRIKGFEAIDGRTRPSQVTYERVQCSVTATISAGDVVTIGAASGKYVQAVAGGIQLANVSGTVPGSTVMTVGGSPVGQTAMVATMPTSVTAAEDAQYLVDAAAMLRTAIQKPAGSGAIRGAVLYAGTLYCFRDNAGATAGVMLKATASGWTVVDLGEEVAFSNANTSVGEADTLTQGAVTATVKRVVVETGSLASGTNTGRLILSGRAGGNYAAGAATSTGGGAVTLSGAQSAITLPAGGSYQFDIYNFFGGSTTRRLYGANGVGYAFEWDGTVFVPIHTNSTPDTPAYVRANRNYLELGVGSTLVGSVAGNPYRYVGSEGAIAIGLGDDITGLVSLPGEALGLLGRNTTAALIGATQSTASLSTVSRSIGAVARTAVAMTDAYYLDTQGICSLAATQNYGSFGSPPVVSNDIKPLIKATVAASLAAVAVTSLSVYRLFRTDGRVISMLVSGPKVLGFSRLEYPFTPSCVWSGEDSDGTVRTFCGASDGWVYELDVGSTFDGAAIESFATVYYVHSGSPQVVKRYWRAQIGITSELYTALRFFADFSYGDPEVETHNDDSLAVGGSGGNWDEVNWDVFFWDSQRIAAPVVPIDGEGTNIALTFYSNTKLDFGHTLSDCALHYSPRRIARG